MNLQDQLQRTLGGQTVTAINCAAFARLADAAINAELREHGVDDLVENDPELKAAIEQIESESRAVAIKDAAQGIVELKRLSNSKIESLVSQLRSTRARERELLAQIASVNKAKDFAAATRNYLPLIGEVTGRMHPEFTELAHAIDNWKPETAAKASKASKK